MIYHKGACESHGKFRSPDHIIYTQDLDIILFMCTGVTNVCIYCIIHIHVICINDTNASSYITPGPTQMAPCLTNQPGQLAAFNPEFSRIYLGICQPTNLYCRSETKTSGKFVHPIFTTLVRLKKHRPCAEAPHKPGERCHGTSTCVEGAVLYTEGSLKTAIWRAPKNDGVFRRAKEVDSGGAMKDGMILHLVNQIINRMGFLLSRRNLSQDL